MVHDATTNGRKFPRKFPESYTDTGSQISSRISRNLGQAQTGLANSMCMEAGRGTSIQSRRGTRQQPALQALQELQELQTTKKERVPTVIEDNLLFEIVLSSNGCLTGLHSHHKRQPHSHALEAL